MVFNGTEKFDTIANGAPAIEHPAPGGVIWRDDVGVTCRCWNWRQGTRTLCDSFTGRMWFVLESLDTMPMGAVDEAATALETRLRKLIPGCTITRDFIAAANLETSSFLNTTSV